ncbi:MAG: hypothetical protein H7835_03175 [Magnetococcus sp. XQGC-1]
MPFSEPILRGIELLLLGAGGSLAFTLFLQGLIGQMSRFCALLEPCQPALVVPLRVDVERERMAAVAVAVHKYRSRQQRTSQR